MFVQLIRSNLEPLILGLMVLQVVLIFLVIWSLVRTNSISRRFKVLLNGTGNDNLEEILLQALEQSKANQAALTKLVDQQLEMRTTLARCLQHRNVHRFDAFSNLGGEQSFSVVLMDDKGDGMVISSLYGRDESRTYAKPLTGGKSKYALSDEEAKAINDAMTRKGCS